MTENISLLDRCDSGPSSHDLHDLGADRASIDKVLRPLLMCLLISASFWLVVSTALFGLSIIKMQWPTVCDLPFMSFGRISPAASHTFVYGWCSMVSLGLGLWIIARLSGRVSYGGTMAFCGLLIWNFGVALGVVSILFGGMRPFLGAEASLASMWIIMCGFGLIAFWAFLSFDDNNEEVPASKLFIAAAMAWFLWSGTVGNILISCDLVKGVMEHLVALWSWHGVIWMWLVPCALGISHYVFPKAVGSVIFSGVLGRGGFWLFFLIAGLGSALKLCGGPIPLWLGTVSACSSLVLIVPLGMSLYNLLRTGVGSTRLSVSPAGIFIRFGLVILGFCTVLLGLSSLRSSANILHFTLFGVGLEKLILLGSISMILFGGIYYLMPRLSRCEWMSSWLISVHFLASAYGACMAGAMLMLSGLISGSDLADGASPFSQVLTSGAFFYWGILMSAVLSSVGCMAFLINFILIVVKIGQPEGTPTVLAVSQTH